jgi:cobalt-zinc-cadmium efflux system protein
MNGRGHAHDVHAPAGPADDAGGADNAGSTQPGQHGDHTHSHVSRETQRRALWISLVANGVFMVVEVAGGIVFNSLALIADAAHMLSDVAGLGVALVAQHLIDRRATARHSYGLQRAEVLGAQANGLALLVVAGWVIYEAIRRIGTPADVAGGGLLVIASIGLVVNVVSAVLLARAQGRSLNMRGAFIHMAADAMGSIAAMIAGIAVLAWNADWVDPVASIAIALLVLWSAWGLLRDTAQVLLEGTPRGMDPASVEATLEADAEVEAVHHLHLWNLASDVPALSAHVVLRGEVSLHEAQASGDRLKALLERRFGITHATLELECHPCDPAPDEQMRSGDGHRG